MSTIRTILRSLADVEGVIGSFVIESEGGLVDTDLPATFDASVFEEAGPRIVRLADLGASFGENVRFLVIRFAEHKLYVRSLATGFLGIVVSLNTSLPALKIAANLVARRVDGALANGSRSAVPPSVEDRRSAVPAFPEERRTTIPTSAPSQAPVSQNTTTRTLPSAPQAAAPTAPPQSRRGSIPPPPAVPVVAEPTTTPDSAGPRRSIRFRGRSAD